MLPFVCKKNTSAYVCVLILQKGSHQLIKLLVSDEGRGRGGSESFHCDPLAAFRFRAL